MALMASGDLIEQIYDAALDPQAWPALLAQVCDAIGGSSAWLSKLDVRTGNGTGMIARIDPVMPGLYSQYYGEINPVAKVENAQGFMNAWRPIILTDEDRLPKETLVKSEFYADFLAPQDIHSTMMIRLGASGYSTAVVNIHRSHRQGRFERTTLEGARTLHSHLIRAFRITERLEVADALSTDLSSSLDLSSDAMFVLDGGGRLRHANSPALQLLAGRRRFRLMSGYLRVSQGDEDKMFQALVGAAGSPTQRRGGSMCMSQSQNTERLMVTVAPVQPERLSVFHDGPAILVCVGGAAARASKPEATLGAMLNLSPAELRVGLALLEGMTPGEAAVMLRLSIHTIRAHLARMFAKTGTRRQSELVSLMTRTVDGR